MRACPAEGEAPSTLKNAAGVAICNNMSLQVKICCIGSIAEAETAICLGADALGLVSRMPSGPGVIPDAVIADIARAVPDHIATFLLTSLRAPEQIIEQHQRMKTDAIQLCDGLPEGAHDELRRNLPGVLLVQVIHVVDETAIDEAAVVARSADMLLLDSGRPSGTVKVLGGTGRRHDWSVSKRICERVSVPVFLAGGLRPENVAEAVRIVRPAGVDVCTGVRTGGRLDADKAETFILHAKSGRPL